MQNTIFTILISSILTSILILFFSLIFGIFKNHISPKAQYWSWIALFIGLLFPFRPTIGNGLIHISAGQAEMAPPDTISVATTSQETNTLSLVTEFPWMQLLLLVWFGGVLFHVIKHLLAFYRYHQMIRRWGTEIEDLHVLEIFFDMKQRFGIQKEIQLLHYPPAHSPMMTGFRNLKILLPELDYTDDELELIFEHELTHYLHKDIYVNLLGIIVTSLYWFNPIVKFGYKEIQESGEIYCDYAVLKERDNQYRSFYGETIITMIDQSQKQPIALTTCFYSNKFNLKRRITAIMSSVIPKRLLSSSLVLIIPMILLFTGSIFSVGIELTSASQYLPSAPQALSKQEAVEKLLEKAKVSPTNKVEQAQVHLDGNTYRISFQTQSHQFSGQVSRNTGQVTGFKKVALPQKTTDTDSKTPASNTLPTSQAPAIEVVPASSAISPATPTSPAQSSHPSAVTPVETDSSDDDWDDADDVEDSIDTSDDDYEDD